MKDKKNKKNDEIKRLKEKIKELEKSQAESKKAEEKIYKANRLYAVLRQVNQAVVRIKDKQKLLQEICNIAIKYGKFRLAWIGFVDEQTKLLKPIAYSGEGSDYLKNIKISITDELTGEEPATRATLERRPIVLNDLENNSDYKSWRKQELGKGYHSSAAFPIRLFNNVIGILKLYAIEPDFFDKDEIFLIEETTKDISFALEKYKEKERLKESEYNYRILFDNMSDGIFILDAETMKVVLANKAVAEMYRIDSEDDITNLNPIDFILPEYKEEAHRVIIEDMFKKDLHQINEFRSITKDGREIWISAVGVKTEYQGRLAGLISIRDITERKKAEEALLASRNYLEKLTNSMWDAVFSVKMPERVIEWANDSFRLIGYEPIECIGKDTAFLYPSKDEFLGFGNKLKDAMEEGKDVLWVDQLLKRKSGETFPAEITVTFYRENDKVVSVTSIVRDITERKKAEKELKRHQNHLEEMVKERTAELEEANKELKRYNKLFVGREFRIKELKDKVKELEKESARKKD